MSFSIKIKAEKKYLYHWSPFVPLDQVLYWLWIFITLPVDVYIIKAAHLILHLCLIFFVDKKEIDLSYPCLVCLSNVLR